MEPLKFIKHFLPQGRDTKTVDTFTQGCCYWFAYILFIRFADIPDTAIMIDQVENHFGTMINGRVYDITGDVTDIYEWQWWGDIVLNDETLAERIKRDCIKFKEPEEKK